MKFTIVLAIAVTSFLPTSVFSEVGTKVRYDNYKVYRFVPHTEAERQVLLELQRTNPGVIFWKGVKNVGQPVDVMFPPHLEKDIVSSFMRRKDISTTLFVNDVQKLIDEEAAGVLEAGKALNWTSYAPLEEIYKYLDDQAAAHSDIAQVVTIGQSAEGRDLKVLKISKSGETKPAIWYDSTIHAREWISGATCTYLVNELLNSDKADMQKLTEDFDWYIMCVANPDGYVYTHTTDRMWRKTRSTTSSPFGCRGADPNRNWAYRWGTGGSSNLPCDDTFMGASAFSEVEVLAMSNYYNTIANRAVFFLSIHSYSQLILLPYGYSNERYTDYQEYMRIGQAGADALAQRYNTRFTVGNIVDLLYVSSGGSVDWIKGVHDTSLVLAMELRDTGRYGFILPADQIIPSSEELIDSIVELVKQLRARIGMTKA